MQTSNSTHDDGWQRASEHHRNIDAHHRRDADRREAAGRPYSAPPAQGYRTHRATRRQRITVKLGPIGARRVSAGLSFVQQNSGNAFIFRRFRRFLQAEKAAGHQVVWS
jgi:hypothetical protein